ncbi:MAG: hypothetical protein LBB39_03960 [Mycoplasmataceae bacterium]|nr:hypothetical protein [Mycoplasmataceae bacterium]
MIALSVYVFIDGFYLLHKIKMQEKSEKETISSLINQIDFSLSNKKMLEEKMLNNPILAEILDRKYAKKFYIPICGFFSKFYLCERTNTVLISVQDLYFSTFIGLLPLLLLNAIVWVFFAIFYPSISTLGYIIFALSWIVILYSIICFLIGIIIFVKLKKKKVNFLDRVPKKRD